MKSYKLYPYPVLIFLKLKYLYENFILKYITNSDLQANIKISEILISFLLKSFHFHLNIFLFSFNTRLFLFS